MGELAKKFCADILIRVRSTAGKNFFSPASAVSHRFRLGRNTFSLLALVPEILCEYLKPKMNPRRAVALGASPTSDALNGRRGVLLCHALSPYLETIGLFGDIGRGHRIALGLGLPELRVMLAAAAWTEFNWVVLDLGLRDNLPLNQSWREQLYARLGVAYDVCTIENAPNVPSANYLRVLASDYVKLASAVWGVEFTRGKLGSDQVRVCLTEMTLPLARDPKIDLLELGVLRPHLAAPRRILESVAKNLSRLDYETFIYFFLQSQHQLRYNGFLKVAVSRERDFDEPFRLIQEAGAGGGAGASAENQRDLTGLYLEDYSYGSYFDVEQGMVSLTAHPYYFPSGSVYALFRKNLSEAVARVIMLSDGVDKIEQTLTGTDSSARARLVSDLLSFAHLMSESEPEIRKRIAAWMRAHSAEFGESWDFYAGEGARDTFGRNCREWSEIVFTNFAGEMPLPYHFLPFVWRELVSVRSEAELLALILDLARECFGLPDVARALPDAG